MTNACGWVPKPIDAVKSAYGLPADAVFLGYVVWLRATDEFLVSVQKFPRKWKKGSAVGRIWTKYPQIAKVFSDHRDAWQAAQDYERDTPEVVHLFDTADQLFVAFDG